MTYIKPIWQYAYALRPTHNRPFRSHWDPSIYLCLRHIELTQEHAQLLPVNSF